jgi:two-component system KDP operon response regulator KdpE
MLNSKHGLILLFTDQPDNWIMPLLEKIHEFHIAPDLQNAVKMLQYVRYDLIMLDDTLFGGQLLTLIRDIKRRFPHLPLIILSENADPAYYASLLRSGVDDLLSPRLSGEELDFHVRVMLERHHRNRALVQRNQNLHTIASLPRLLEANTDFYTVILQAVRIITNMFRVNGVSVVLADRFGYRLYAGTPELVGQHQLIERDFRPTEFDPFLWTIQSKFIQVYRDVRENPNFLPIDSIQPASGAVILPLPQQGDQVGAVAIFAPPDTEISNDDVFIYEQFSRQLSSVLRNVSQHQAQNLVIRLNEQLLGAWGDFSGLQTPIDVAQALCMKISEVLANHRVAVWYDSSDVNELHNLWVDSHDGLIADVLMVLDWQEINGHTGNWLRQDNQPSLISEESGNSPSLHALLTAMQAHQVLVVPVLINPDLSARAFIGVDDNYHYDIADMNLIGNIAQIAALTLERVRLSNSLLENHGRLMSILCSVNEGIFFVDEHNRVVFCNPQVKEMVQTSVSEFINHDSEVLLRAISDCGQSPTQIYTQLQEARNSVFQDDETERRYPIVSVPVSGQGADLQVEFSKVFGQDETISWIGVIHHDSRAKRNGVIDALLEKIRVPYAQVRSQISTLVEQHGHFGYRERDKLIAQIEGAVNSMGREWDHFVDLYKLQSGGVTLHRELVNLQNLMEHLLEARQFMKHLRYIQVELPPALPSVKVDEFSFERALANILERALNTMPPNGMIRIRVENRSREVRIHFEGADNFIPAEKLEQTITQLDYLPDIDTAFLDVYVAGETIRRNGGRAWVDNGVVISLPTAPAPTDMLPAPEAAETKPTPSPVIASRAPSREANAIMLLQGKSNLSERMYRKLQSEGYEVLLYKSGEEAVRDVNATHLDLIIIDTNLNDGSGIKVCKQIRQHTETPVLLVSDNASDQEKVQGFNAGADDFITRSISDDEMVVRLRAIFNRRHIPERVSEPLVIDDMYIDFARRAVFLSNTPIELTRIEYDLLYTLVMNRGQTVTHKQLLTQVWGPEYQDEIQYLWVNISRLRRKLEPTNNSPRYIRTQPGIGYYFEAP